MDPHSTTLTPSEAVAAVNNQTPPVVLRVKRKAGAGPNSSLVMVPKKCRRSDGDELASFVADFVHSGTQSSPAELVTSLKRALPSQILDDLATSSKRLRVIDLEMTDLSTPLRVTGNDCIQLDKALLTSDGREGAQGVDELVSEFGAMDAFNESEPFVSEKVSRISNGYQSNITINGLPMLRGVLSKDAFEGTAFGDNYDYYVADACDDSLFNWDTMSGDIDEMFAFEIVGKPDSSMDDWSNCGDEEDSEDSNAENYFRNDYPDEEVSEEEQVESVSSDDSYDSYHS